MSGIRKTIAVLAGDGIGPEVIGAAIAILRECAASFSHRFEFVELPFGGAAIDRCGEPLPAETLEACKKADAVLLGAVGGPKWDSQALACRPEAGLLALRKELGLYINVRPVRLLEPLKDISPLRLEDCSSVDLEIVRELAGGIYFGPRKTGGSNGSETASDTEIYSSKEIERVALYAFRRAAARRGHLASIDKANVLASSALWRKTVHRLAEDFPEVTLNSLYVDNAALQLILRPAQFDVMLTSNMFGDILSDEAAALVGSIGLIPSMSLGNGTALYEPIHGSAPQLAGKDSANPIGTILCAAMMLRESFGLPAAAAMIEHAVTHTLAGGFRTPDIDEPGMKRIGCAEITSRIRQAFVESHAEAEHYGWGV
ncbi:MAG TPA: 3-isopropylmalate dehydrogenase [Candidatus Acidoferrales bacterium]|nr:3-isopropylmalate dehydrogenase [Candidatus Acidoferrales bacterium]